MARKPHPVTPRVLEVFRECSSWRDSPASVVEGLLAAATIYRAEMGDLVLDPHSSEHFVLVISGRVRTRVEGPGGHELTFASAVAGELLALPTAIQRQPAGTEFVATQTSVVAVIPIDALWAALDRSPAIAHALLHQISARFLSLVELMSMRDADVVGRLSAFILKLAASTPADQPELDLGMSRRELASRLGTAPETLSRAFGRLREDGLIATRGRRWVTVLDAAALESIHP